MAKALAFLTCLALAAITVPANAALITYVHALPPLANAVPSNNPIDIALDDECVHSYEPYGAKLGPSLIEAGTHLVYFYESRPQRRCRGPVLAVIQLEIEADDEIDVALGLSADDQVAIRVFDNTKALDLIERGIEAAVEVRSVAAGPTLQAVLKRGSTMVGWGDVPSGQALGPFPTTTGRQVLQVLKGPDLLDQVEDRIRRNRAYWVYIGGSVIRNTVDLLAIESLPDDEIPGVDPPRTPRASACCFRPNICSQISSRNCQQAGGLFIGDVQCRPGVCP